MSLQSCFAASSRSWTLSRCGNSQKQCRVELEFWHWSCLLGPNNVLTWCRVTGERNNLSDVAYSHPVMWNNSIIGIAACVQVCSGRCIQKSSAIYQIISNSSINNLIIQKFRNFSRFVHWHVHATIFTVTGDSRHPHRLTLYTHQCWSEWIRRSGTSLRSPPLPYTVVMWVQMTFMVSFILIPRTHFYDFWYGCMLKLSSSS